MSRIAKQPINIPDTVTFNDDDLSWSVKGPKGSLSLKKKSLR